MEQSRYVGPFFYINNKLICKKIEISKGDVCGDFINHPQSHFDFFNEISSNKYDDYGHYIRGRVIYNKKTNAFYVYVDKSIVDNKEVINDIKIEYNLTSDNVVIKKDEHYTHDEL